MATTNHQEFGSGRVGAIRRANMASGLYLQGWGDFVNRYTPKESFVVDGPQQPWNSAEKTREAPGGRRTLFGSPADQA